MIEAIITFSLLIYAVTAYYVVTRNDMRIKELQKQVNLLKENLPFIKTFMLQCHISNYISELRRG